MVIQMEVGRLELAIQAEATKASAELDKLISKLNTVSNTLSSVNTGGLNQLSSGITQLSVAMQLIGNSKTSSFTRLSNNIQKLGSINTGNMTSIASSVNVFSNAINGISASTGNLQQISEIVSSVSKFGSASMQKAATNLPLLANALRNFIATLSTAPNVSGNIINLTNAMANLAQFGSKYNSTINSITRASNALEKANYGVAVSTKSMGASVGVGFAKLVAAAYTVKRAFDFVGGSIVKSMDFTETINLFQTSFKKIGMEAAQSAGLEWGSEAANQFAVSFIDEAQDFNDMLVEALSLDPNTLMNYQAVFAQMANGFGLTNDSVMNLSKSFTMLGLDIASLFNTDIETAMTKLRSGLAGETEPLRALGVDITETTLKMTALKYGIEDSVNSMSQAAKTQLRYLAIMDQTSVAFGDMAKTIDSPSNQLRVLQQQWNNLSRSIGNVFMPIVATVIPYVNALVIALRRMIDAFASAVGFELPDYSDSDIYTGVTGGLSEIGDTADGSTSSVNKLKKALLGIDELNVLSTGSSGLKSGAGAGGGYSELDDIIGKQTNSYMNKFNEELAKMKSKAEELADVLQPKLETLVEWIDKLTPAFAGVAAAFVTYKLITWFSNLAGAIGALSMSPAGVIALAVGGLALIYTGVKEYNEKLKKEDLASRFGKITLSLQEIEDIADRLTSNKYTANIDIFVTENAKLSEIEKSIQSDLNTLNKLNWKVSVGLELTPQEQEEYKSTIESFISNSQKYIEQQHYVTKLAIDAVIQDTNFKKEISALVDEYYNGSKGEMERLGKQLRSSMDEALADGIISAEEQKVIDNIIKEMNAIAERVADAEFKAKLQMITIEGDLSADSFKDLTKKIQDTISERTKKAEEATYTALASVNASYTVKMENATTQEEKNEIQRDWDRDVKEITDNMSQTKALISFDGTEFSIDTLIEKYGTELDKSSFNIKDKTKSTFTKEIVAGITNADPQEGIDTLIDGMFYSYTAGLDESGLSKATKDGLAEMLAELEPTEEQYQKIYDDALKTGSKIPEGISDQLTDIQNLKALADDRDAILFLIGQEMASSPEYLAMIEAASAAGVELDENIIKGIKSKVPDLKVSASGVITSINGQVKKEVKDSGKPAMSDAAANMLDGMSSKFSKDTTVKSAMTTMLDGVNTTVKNYKMSDITIAFKATTEAIDAALKKYGMYGNISLPTPNIPGFAGGGYPTPGQLFIANEPGNPELIGDIAGRTGVINNNQIVESVSGGVADAVARVLVPALMNSNNGGGEIVVENYWYTSDEKLYQSTQRGKIKSDRRFQTINKL